jgi:hypothetical protein
MIFLYVRTTLSTRSQTGRSIGCGSRALEGRTAACSGGPSLGVRVGGREYRLQILREQLTCLRTW